MCGIAGVFAYANPAPPVDRAELVRVRDFMINRGPDGEGLWISPDQRTGLAHRRLAIIDLSEAGAQPMSSADGHLCITFNGEIYNYPALRRELEARGRVFKSHSDTEVLLHLYEEHGPEMLHRLRGMYAFALWNAREQSLFLARDPFGIKPLYYADDGKTLRFASQVKALVAGGAVDTAHESAGAAGFLLWGCVPEPFTLYRGVSALPAGTNLTVRRDVRPIIAKHFSVRDELVRAQQEARPFTAKDRTVLSELLRDSVSHHLLADVPVGVFLSAGMDSTLVAGLAAEHSGVSLRSVTLGFEEFRGSADDETVLAESFAAAHGCTHETHWIHRVDFEASIESMLAAMDQPSIDGVNTWFVCREAARAGLKVALSGLGGDEIFGGYPSFQDVPRMARWLRPASLVPWAGKLSRMALAPVLSAITSPKYSGLLEYGGSFEGAYLLRRALYMPWELREVLDPVAVRTGLERLQTLPQIAASLHGIKSSRARVAALELTWYMKNQLLRDADWAGMAHSVEVRVPLVDATLFREMAPWLVSERAPSKMDAAMSPLRAPPPEMLERRKSGFSVPVRTWLAERAGTASSMPERGLRQWAKLVLPHVPRQIRVLALVTDAFGGYGGIAKFNRDFISSVAAMASCAEVVAIPRLVPVPPESLPRNVTFVTAAARGKSCFAMSTIRAALAGPFDLVVVGHINFTFFGALAAWMTSAPALLIIHGIDAWTPHSKPTVKMSLSRMARVIGVSDVTLQRFQGWANADPGRFRMLPNCVDLDTFTPGPKPADLVTTLGLKGRTVIMTLGRLSNEERYKGFDEVIDTLPKLAREIPNIVYLICGDGPDRPRLEEKARQLGVSERVVFAGFIPDSRKVDFYRLADGYVMPSHGEGFGIVFLEAMACGIPVMGSKLDGGREALREGTLGVLVDPEDNRSVFDGILAIVRAPKGVPDGLDYFSDRRYRERVVDIVSELVPPSASH